MVRDQISDHKHVGNLRGGVKNEKNKRGGGGGARLFGTLQYPLSY